MPESKSIIVDNTQKINIRYCKFSNVVCVKNFHCESCPVTARMIEGLEDFWKCWGNY